MTNETKTSTLECMDDSFEIFRDFNNPDLIIHKIPLGFDNLDKAIGDAFFEEIKKRIDSSS